MRILYVELLFRTRESSENKEQQSYKGQARDRHLSHRLNATNVRIHPIETQSLSNDADYVSQCSGSKPSKP